MGPSTRTGLELFLKEFPSLAGAHILLDVEDNRGNARDGLSAFHSLQSRDTVDLVFLMTQLSGVAAAIAPLSDQSGIIQFGLAASPSLLQSKYSIRNYASADRIGETMAHVLDSQSFSTYVVLALNDEYGVTVAEAAKTAAAKKEKQLILEQRFETNLKDTASLAQQAIHKNPDAILVTGFGSAPVGIIRKLREAGYKGNIIADPAAAYRPYTKLIGDAAEGLWLVDLDFPNNSYQRQRDFVSAYRQMFHSEPDVPAALAYAGLEIYAAATAKAGSTEPSKVLNAPPCVNIT
jgi:branched-chain amino acid transport system substrate-binding protein